MDSCAGGAMRRRSPRGLLATAAAMAVAAAVAPKRFLGQAWAVTATTPSVASHRLAHSRRAHSMRSRPAATAPTPRNPSGPPWGLSAARPAKACLVALAATNAASKARKRRRRNLDGIVDRPPPEEPKLTKREQAAIMQPEDVARKLGVEDEDRAEMAKEKRDLRGRVKVQEVDPIKELVEGDDPTFFGAPFIWVQLAHVFVALTFVLVAIGGNDDELSVWAQPPVVTNAVRQGLILITFVNLGLAAFTFWEEDKLGKNRIDAVGWGLKVALLGGVATWQRNWRNRPSTMKKSQSRMKDKTPKASGMAR